MCKGVTDRDRECARDREGMFKRVRGGERERKGEQVRDGTLKRVSGRESDREGEQVCVAVRCSMLHTLKSSRNLHGHGYTACCMNLQ